MECAGFHRRTIQIPAFLAVQSRSGRCCYPFLPGSIPDQNGRCDSTALPAFVNKGIGLTRGDATRGLGFCLAAQPFTKITASQIWGMVVDRFGRKRMLLRATFAAGLVFIAMFLVQSVEQLLLLRLARGFRLCVVSTAGAYVAANVPQRHLSEVMDWVATAR